MKASLSIILSLALYDKVDSFTIVTKCNSNARIQKTASSKLAAEMNENNNDLEYKNAATSILSNFMNNNSNNQSGSDVDVDGDGDDNDNVTNAGTSNKSKYDENPVLSKIDFKATKFTKVPIETLALILDAELYEKEWFVTGNVNPIYFDDNFEFQDPDVKLSGIEDYAKGVNKLFDQETSRAEIISTKVKESDDDDDLAVERDTITVTWRLSGKVNIGPGLTIKPYICYTDLKVDSETGLITFQEDRFDIPQWDILLSALFPFLIGKVTSEPAPPVPVRDVPKMPKTASSGIGGFSLDAVFGQIFN